MPRCRPLKLIDVMIVTACAAMGMAQMRPIWNRMAARAGANGLPWRAYAEAVQMA